MRIDRYGRQVQTALIGCGKRGITQLKLLLTMPDVVVTAVCDTQNDRIQEAADLVEHERGTRPFVSNDYHECVNRTDVEAVLIMTAWENHIEIAVEALLHGKRPAMEVGGATSVEECWKLVRTSEQTGIPVMLLENCCYGEKELALLNMIHHGVFGTVVHCEGAYAHDLRDEIGNGDIDKHYRQRHFFSRCGELYPTHELGPIANYLGINRGNRMVSLVSMASKSCGLKEWLSEHRSDRPELERLPVNEGDIVTTLIRCANGETIMLKHDCTLPRPYSRGGAIHGTKGTWQEDNRGIFIEGETPVDPADWAHHWESDERWMEKYDHPIWREYRKIGLRGEHDGMDYLVLRAFFESVQNNTRPPIDVYDAAAWMSITALSEASIACGSMPVTVPDFTGGRWLLPVAADYDNPFDLNRTDDVQ